MRTSIIVAQFVALALFVSASAWAGDPEAGRKVFEDAAKKCQICHSIKGKGGPAAAVGGPLDGVGAKRDAEWLKKFLRDPKSVNPESKMAKIALTDAELEDLVAYLLTLKEAK